MAINHEFIRNRNKYTPTYWIVNDGLMIGKILEEEWKFECECFPGTNMILGKSAWGSPNVREADYFESFCNLEWANRITRFSYIGHRERWESGRGIYLMDKTTATVCVQVLYDMGIRDIILVGVDCCKFGDDYYYKGKKEREPETFASYGNVQINSSHMRMIQNFLDVKSMLAEREACRIYQTSLHSPLSCFPKKDLEEAVLEIHNNAKA